METTTETLEKLYNIQFNEYKKKLGYLGVPIVNDGALMKWFDKHIENISKEFEDPAKHNIGKVDGSTSLARSLLPKNP